MTAEEDKLEEDARQSFCKTFYRRTLSSRSKLANGWQAAGREQDNVDSASAESDRILLEELLANWIASGNGDDAMRRLLPLVCKHKQAIPMQQEAQSSEVCNRITPSDDSPQLVGSDVVAAFFALLNVVPKPIARRYADKLADALFEIEFGHTAALFRNRVNTNGTSSPASCRIEHGQTNQPRP